MLCITVVVVVVVVVVFGWVVAAWAAVLVFAAACAAVAPTPPASGHAASASASMTARSKRERREDVAPVIAGRLVPPRCASRHSHAEYTNLAPKQKSKLEGDPRGRAPTERAPDPRVSGRGGVWRESAVWDWGHIFSDVRAGGWA